MEINAHQSFCPVIFKATFPKAIGQVATQKSILRGFQHPLDFDLNDVVKKNIRDMLRQKGFKPTGRNKPASEYLRKALIDNRLNPNFSINAAVDICNVVSLHSGLPISVVDAKKLQGRLKIGQLPMNTAYAFNPSGQMLKGDGLLALCDEVGPSATPVKDAQRTKTDAHTVETIWVIWGHDGHKDRIEYAWKKQVEFLSLFNAVMIPMTQDQRLLW